MNHRPAIAVVVLGVSAGSCAAQVVTDTFEDLLDSQSVISRSIGPYTYTISTATGAVFTSRTYGVSTPLAFGGGSLPDNTPLNPAEVSGVRFISTVTNNASADRFDTVSPIEFAFAEPIQGFGVTTLDLLEETSAASFLEIQLFDADDNLVATDRVTGSQGGSGIDVDLFAEASDQVVVRAVLTGEINRGFAYGLDDVVIFAPDPIPSPVTWPVLGGVVLAMRRQR
ncbi:MAG: hypothetical protein AAGJ54_06015 [Planctomycetota bacterium]